MMVSPATNSRVRRWTARFLDVLLPARCLKCGRTVFESGALCTVCWPDLRFLAPPHCRICGFPFEHDAALDGRCGACLADAPPFERARAVFVYDDDSRDIVLAFKHADRTFGAEALARWMVRAGAELLDGTDLVAPVPLHRGRLWRRRYNQSALLARAIARLSGLRFAPDLLVRHRPTPPQGRQSPSARRRNVRGAFRVAPGWPVDGRRVLLIDDVYTTGATVAECTKTLLATGAKAVDVLTLARVVRPADPF